MDSTRTWETARLPSDGGGVNPTESGMGDEADGRLDREGVARGSTDDERAIDLLDPPFTKGRGHRAPRLGSSREQHETRRAPAQPVQGCRLRVEPPHDVEQGVGQEAPVGHRGQAAGLRHGQEVRVAMEDGEGEGNRGLFPGRPAARRAPGPGAGRSVAAARAVAQGDLARGDSRPRHTSSLEWR